MDIIRDSVLFVNPQLEITNRTCPTDQRVKGFIAKNRGTWCRDIARSLNLSPSIVARSLDRLKATGHVGTAPDHTFPKGSPRYGKTCVPLFTLTSRPVTGINGTHTGINGTHAEPPAVRSKPARKAALRTVAPVQTAPGKVERTSPPEMTLFKSPGNRTDSGTQPEPSAEKTQVPYSDIIQFPNPITDPNDNNNTGMNRTERKPEPNPPVESHGKNKSTGENETTADTIRDSIGRIERAYRTAKVQHERNGFISTSDLDNLTALLLDSEYTEPEIIAGLDPFMREKLICEGGSWLRNHSMAAFLSPRHMPTWISESRRKPERKRPDPQPERTCGNCEYDNGFNPECPSPDGTCSEFRPCVNIRPAGAGAE